MVVGVQPVAHIQAVAVEGQLLALESVGDEEGDELLRILVGAVGVRAPGDEDGEAVGAVVGEDLKVAARLGRGVGAGGCDLVTPR